MFNCFLFVYLFDLRCRATLARARPSRRGLRLRCGFSRASRVNLRTYLMLAK